jgi:cation diffusion facilitator family transporter
MAAHSSTHVIYAAFIGNALIAVSKFFAASISGSSAMLSEGIHSVVDCGNQLLLLYGIRRAKKPSDATHPFGYGMELYFWTFVVAILIFALGAGISIYEGIDKVRHPTPVTSLLVSYIVLFLSMIFEGVAWSIAYREFQKSRGDQGLIQAVRNSKDPTVFTVLFEDTAAMLGLIVAFAGIAGSQMINMPALDGYASIAIGIILAIVAVLLAIESKGLLIGEGAHPDIVDHIKLIVQEDVRILQINEVLTMHLGPRRDSAQCQPGFRRWFARRGGGSGHQPFREGNQTVISCNHPHFHRSPRMEGAFGGRSEQPKQPTQRDLNLCPCNHSQRARSLVRKPMGCCSHASLMARGERVRSHGRKSMPGNRVPARYGFILTAAKATPGIG